MSVPIQVVFFGTSDQAVPTLVALCKASHFKVLAVVTQPDKPIGRKQVITPTPVTQAAKKLGLPIIHSLREIATVRADIGVLVSYGKIIHENTLRLFPHGIVNIHPSVLPAWRGPAPVQAALLAGDNKTGVSIMLLDKGMDTGPILAQHILPIKEIDTAQTLYFQLFSLGTAMLLEVLPQYIDHTIRPQAQDETKATYSHIISRPDGKISGQDSVGQIIRKLKALQPWPGVYGEWKGKRIKILAAHQVNGSIILDQVQLEGKRPMSYLEFMQGYPDFLLTDVR